MLLGLDVGSYLSSMFIAFSFVPMVCAYTYFEDQKIKVAGISAISFSVMYAVIILLVYFAQLTTVQNSDLTKQTRILLDFQQFDLFFNYDMLGYALMSLTTFFLDLIIEVRSKSDQYLRIMLLLHGLFFISCLILLMLGVFIASGEAWIGIMILEFWCGYFIPIGILSSLHFHRLSST